MGAILLEFAWEVIKENRRAYLIINGLFYALLIGSMGYAAIVPSAQTALLNTAGDSLMTGSLSMVGKGYGITDVLTQLGVLFLGNLMGTNFLGITVPTLIIPFSGLALGSFHAIQWGLLFSPADPTMRSRIVMHSLSLILEGQANILAMLGAYILGRGIIWPRSIGVATRRAAFMEGLRQAGALYSWVVLALALDVLYGLVEVSFLAQYLH